MAVLTHKEYEKKKLSQKNITQKAVHQSTVKSNKKAIRTWFLLHPENGYDHYQNFEDELKLDGKTYKRECVQGVVKTNQEKLANFLIKKGYEVLEVKNGTC
jgi:hypothetical protein